MRRLALVVVICLVGCGGGEKLATTPAAPRQLQVSSPDFASGGAIPRRFSCQGDGDRPALRIGGVPSHAAELAVLVTDPDANGFVHWTVWDVPPSTRELGSTRLPADAHEGGSGWTAPCPPDGTHRYEFRVYWLKSASGLSDDASPDDVAKAIRARAGGDGLLVGRYTKR